MTPRGQQSDLHVYDCLCTMLPDKAIISGAMYTGAPTNISKKTSPVKLAQRRKKMMVVMILHTMLPPSSPPPQQLLLRPSKMMKATMLIPINTSKQNVTVTG